MPTTKTNPNPETLDIGVSAAFVGLSQGANMSYKEIVHNLHYPESTVRECVEHAVKLQKAEADSLGVDGESLTLPVQERFLGGRGQ